MVRTGLVVLIFCIPALAGCSDSDDSTVEVTDDTYRPPADVGAISGLAIDDRYRPIPGALLLLQPVGLTATSNENGEFMFADLAPGPYTLRIQAEGHEGTPQTVTVTGGDFVEAHIVARRIVDPGSTILTREFAIFLPCVVGVLVDGYTMNCVAPNDQSAIRSGFLSNFTDLCDQATFLVTEVLADKPGGYFLRIQHRDDDPDDLPAEWYAAAHFTGDHVRLVNQYGVQNQEHTDVPTISEGEMAPWMNDRDFGTCLDSYGPFAEELQPVGCCGLGPRLAVTATIVQSLFIGEPEVDMETYCVLC